MNILLVDDSDFSLSLTKELILGTKIKEEYSFCIPFNDDTKHLVGTNKQAPEFYRYWEN